ncbi:ATPase [Vibrio maritimus]|uniref:ATPase n=1 Tax=Vibrio maritimus TaxID=990268 RepID=A0A090TVC5_9VIBR|nr:ATPase [Vibrio maritimus]
MSTRKLIVVLLCVLGVASCASTPPVNDARANLSPKELELTRNKEFEQLTVTYTYWSKALEGAESLRIYAPENYREMMSSWKSAHDLFIEIRKDPNQIDSKHSVFSSETYAVGFRDRINTVEYNYRAIQGLKKQADELLAPAMTEMAYLQKIEAGRYFKHAMNTLSRDYQRLFEHLVVSEVDLATSYQERFLNHAKALEIRVIDAKYVKPLEQKLATLASARYNVLAPVSFGYVEQGIRELSEFVTQSPRAFVEIDEQVERIDFQFRRLESVVQEVTKLINVEKSQFEPFVLEAESRMHHISSAAKGNDYRDQSLSAQSNRIAHDVERLKAADNTRALKKENALLKQQIALLQQQRHDSGVSEEAQVAQDVAAQNRAEIEALKKLVGALQKQAE